jgi:hypothetical protein
MLPAKDLRKNSTIYLVGGSVANEDAANFQARLRNPLLIDGQTEIALAGVVLDFPEDAIVQIGQNSAAGYKLFATQANPYIATLRAGDYNASDLADELQRALNNSGPTQVLESRLAGSWRVGLNTTPDMSYTIRHKESTRAAPQSGNVVLDAGSTYAGGTFTNTAGTTELWGVVNTPITPQVSQFVMAVETATDFSIALMTVGDAHDAANELFRVTYDTTALSFTPYVRGVAGAPIVLGGALAKSTLILCKLGNEIVIGHRPFTAAASDAFTEVLREGLLDSDGNGLIEPNFFTAFGSSTAGANLTSISSTKSMFSTQLPIEIGGQQYTIDGSKLADSSPEIHALLYGSVSETVEAFPPNPSSTRSITLYFDVANTCADLYGFNQTDILVRTSSNLEWRSTTVPTGSLDSSGLQSSLYVTSTALNVDSRFSSRSAESSPFIIGSLPFSSSIGTRSYAEYIEPNPYFQTLAIGSKQTLTSIDIQIRDSRQVIVALPSTAQNQSRSTLKILVRNHPTA